MEKEGEGKEEGKLLQGWPFAQRLNPPKKASPQATRA